MYKSCTNLSLNRKMASQMSKPKTFSSKMNIPLVTILFVVFVITNNVAVTLCQLSHGDGNSASNTVTLSMDITADVDGKKNVQSRDGDSKTASESLNYATYSSQVPEFGMRNQPAKPDSEAKNNYDYKHDSASGSSVVSSEFVPSFFRLSDSRKPLVESVDSNNDQLFSASFGHQTSQTQPVNEMDSPFYSKTAADSADGGGTEDPIGGFAPLGMSVEEAFRKYFPDRKPQPEGSDASPSDEFPRQQQQPQQPQQSQGQPQYITTYADEGNQENVQSTPAKEVISIDSLREIVEKQPLARPNPFDPPSPPLSSFLPPPEAVPGATVIPSPTSQYPASSQPQTYTQSQQSYAQPQQSFSQPEASYVYKTPMEQNEPPPPPPPPASTVVEKEMPEANEDEGLPYHTTNPEEEGKKVSYVYSRPVRLPDVTRTKLVENVEPSSGGGDNFSSGDFGKNIQYGQEMEQIYRKPVSYENEEEVNPDHADQDGASLKQSGSAGYDENEQAYNTKPIADQYQTSINPINNNQPLVSTLDGSYVEKNQQPQWNANEQSRPNYDQTNNAPNRPNYDQTNNGPNRPNYDQANNEPNRPQSIEYGGFVPIRKPTENNYPSGGEYLDRPNQKSALYEMGMGKSNYPEMDPRPPRPVLENNFPVNNNYGPNSGPMDALPPPPLPPANYNGPPPSVNNQMKFPGVSNFLPKLSNLRFRPLYGKDAIKKLRELGISEDEFYGTVNKILQKSHGGNPLKQGMPGIDQRPFGYMPKANLYRAPPKNGNGPRPFMANNKMRPLSNHIGDEFDFNYFKDELPPGASYNPRDVGLDDSVLAQIHLLDSGIGGYRFPTMIPGIGVSPNKPYRPTRPQGGSGSGIRGPLSFKKDLSKSPAYSSSNVPYAMNSMALPFVLTGPKPFVRPPRRMPYSATGKGFRSQYGYRAAAASELKPQFALPKAKPFQFLSQPMAFSASKISPLVASPTDDLANPIGNILGIRSIKGIKSLVSYLTGGVSG